jgi:hypothetical protein
MDPIYLQPPNQPGMREHIGNWPSGEALPDKAFVAALVGASPDRILAVKHVKERGEPIIVAVAV